jgi:hypothetical protein
MNVAPSTCLTILLAYVHMTCAVKHQAALLLERGACSLTKPAKPPPMAGRKPEVLQLRE